MTRVKKIFIAGLLALAAIAARAETEADFAAANRLYQEGKFAAAAAAYAKLPVSATMLFNLGNAELKAGRTGNAIAAFREAQTLAPRAADVRANLQAARGRVSDNFSVRPALWRRAVERLTLNEWALLAAAALWLWFALLALAEWKNDFRRRLGGWTSLAGAALILSCAGTLVARIAAADKIAVVTANEAIIRTGPLEDSQMAYAARDGAELAVLDQRDEWLQVCDTNGRIGWVRRGAATVP